MARPIMTTEYRDLTDLEGEEGDDRTLGVEF